ncbi:MAG TPA: GLPGLI family protein [Flavobacteriales bacterium]|nr:GLPGLI family protein [Flavobacteriales bacterium]
MKSILLILAYFFSFGLFAQQNAVAIYKFIREKDTVTSNDPDRVKAKQLIQTAADYAQNYQYILKFNPNESYYYIDEGLPIDESELNATAYDHSKMMTGSGIFYQNKPNRISINYKHTLGKNYAVTDSLYNTNWQITNDSKYIGKYKVYKAVARCASCQKKVIAWFAPDIPLPFGPAGYGGLPGLILEVKKYKNILRLKKLSFKKKQVEIKLPQNSIPITKQKLEDLQWQRRVEMMQKRR